MKTLAPAAALMVLAAALAGCATTGSQEGGADRAADRAYVQQFVRAEAAGVPFAPITDTAPTADMAAAYRLQSAIVAAHAARGDRMVGYKGGLMSAASMKARNVSVPLVAVLFASGAANSGDTISLCGYRKASFELKLGYVFARRITALPANPAALAGAVSAVLPVIDLPDIAYRDPDHYGAVDMVAANVSAARYVKGRTASPAATDLDALRVSVSRDGQPLTSGLGRESMENQWGSLFALTREILATGRTIAPGQLVITGKIGDRGWLPAGAYRADYGPLGVVDFNVKPCA